MVSRGPFCPPLKQGKKMEMEESWADAEICTQSKFQSASYAQ